MKWLNLWQCMWDHMSPHASPKEEKEDRILKMKKTLGLKHWDEYTENELEEMIEEMNEYHGRT